MVLFPQGQTTLDKLEAGFLIPSPESFRVACGL